MGPAPSLEEFVEEYPELYYMAPMQNAPYIAALGILSYNAVNSTLRAHGIDAKSIADTGVNRRRHWRTVNGKSLHDYVPLYWATHTPMQYVVTGTNGKIGQDDLVFFVVEPLKLQSIAGIWTSDGNVASDETTCYPGWGALPHLDVRILKTEDCYSKEYKRKKAAEVLVPESVPLSAIKWASVRTWDAKTRLDASLKTLRDGLIEKLPNLSFPPVWVTSSLYYGG